MKKTKLTRSLLAACSIVALTAVMYGCVHDGSDGLTLSELDLTGYDTAAGVDVDADTYSTDGVPAALASALEGYMGTTMGNMGDTVTIGGYIFTCVTGPCSVSVSDDGEHVTVEGTINVMAMMEPEPTPDPTAGLFAAAQDARDDAAAASKKASDAVKSATDAEDKLGVLGSNGESKTEHMNAEAILKARDDAADAVTEAQDALDDATAAKTEAEALDDTNEHKTSLIAALDAAITVAEEQLEEATKSNNREDLKDAVEAVTGGEDADPQGTAASNAKAVAEAIGEALGGMTLAAALPRGTIATALPDAAVTNEVSKNNSRGMTWAQIVGEDNVKMMRLGAANTNVSVASIAGMDLNQVFDTVPGDLSGLGTDAATDGANFDSADYLDIDGMLHCLGTDCKVEDGTLEGSWYFQPDSTTATFVKKAADDASTTDRDESKEYETETLYAQYGYWLSMEDHDSSDTTPDVAQINRYALTAGNTAGLTFVKVTDMPDSATYNGEAAGMSVHKMTDTDGAVTSIYSGAFTADVEIVLQFGAGVDATLSGTIDEFESALEGGSMAVDPDWTIELQTQTTFDGSFDDGTTVATGRDGVWSATAYGTSGSRPTGVFGGFNAHFSDGHAAGVYEADDN